MLKKVEKDGDIWIQAKCDNCNEIFQDEEEGLPLMPDKLSMENKLMEHGWIKLKEDDTVNFCPNCSDEKDYWEDE